MYDSHLHTVFSDDAEYPFSEMINAAINKGLDGIAITDHLDPFFPDEDYPFYLEIEKYELALLEAKEKYAPALQIGKGIEIGLQQGEALEVCETTIDRFSYDFVIGSIHAAKGKCIHKSNFTSGRTQEAINTDYYEDMIECLQAYKNYDVLGHINVIDRYAGG